MDHKEESVAQIVPKNGSKRKRQQKQYSEYNLNLAVDAVKSKAMTLGKAAKVYAVPKTTLHFRLGAKWSGKISRGPRPVLTTHEEDKLVKWVKGMEERGFPCTKEALFSKVKAYLDSKERVTIFKENTPGYKWLELFMKRCGADEPLSIRKPENITRAAATVSELDIRYWFRGIGQYFVKHNLSDIVKDPRRVLNGDETMFLFDPETKSVIATKGNRNVYLVQQADAKKNLTVLLTFDADGYMFPPDIIVPYKRLSQALLMSFQPDWGIGKSENGWMDGDNFLANIKNIIHPSLVARKVPLPVIYFVDGHSSHTGLDVAEACESYGIILIALYPNATHIMQPCDVAIFKPLKNQWSKEIDQWKMKNDGRMFTIEHFGPALENSIKNGIQTSTVRAGFRKCGLFPFDENAIDYSRCLPKNPEAQPDSSTFPPASNESSSPVPNLNNDVLPASGLPFILQRAPDCPPCSTQPTVLTSSCVPNSSPLPTDLHPSIKSPVNDSGLGTSSFTMPPIPQSPVYSSPQDFSFGQLPPITDSLSSRDFDAISDYSPELESVQLEETQAPVSSTLEDSFFVSSSLSTLPVPKTPRPGNSFSQLDIVSMSDDQPNMKSTLPKESPLAQPISCSTPLHELTLNGSYIQNTSPDLGHGSKTSEQFSRRNSITDFLKFPPTPKRKEVKRNYKQKRHFILTAAERLMELRELQQEKENVKIRHQEAKELRAAKKAIAEKQKQERKILYEQRRALKKAEIEKKKDEQEKKKMQKIKQKEKKDSINKKKSGRTNSKQIRH